MLVTQVVEDSLERLVLEREKRPMMNNAGDYVLKCAKAESSGPVFGL